MVSITEENWEQANESADGIETVENHAKLLYSVDSGISLTLKEVPTTTVSSPFFGTSSSQTETGRAH